jgi:uncharacterized protein YbcI
MIGGQLRPKGDDWACSLAHATRIILKILLSKGPAMENAIRNAIIKFEQEFMGRGPDDVRASIVRDLVVVRLKGVLTPAERQLAKTAEGVEMVKQLRQNLIAQGRDKLSEQVGDITKAKVLGVFTDIDVQLGERIFVFTLDRELQNGAR